MFSLTSDNIELPCTYHIPVWLHSVTSLLYALNKYICVSPCPLFTPMFDSGRAAYGVGLWRLACWDCGFETRRGHEYLSRICGACSTGRRFYLGLITRPEKSYRLRARVCVYMCVYVCVCVCVSLSVIRCNNNLLHLQRVHRKEVRIRKQEIMNELTSLNWNF